MNKEIFNGFKFGMILQISIGPVCLFIFQTACKFGFFTGEIGVLAVTLIDMTYILAAIGGMGALIEKNEDIKKYLKIFGIAVLMIFGISNILSIFNIRLIPSLNLGYQKSNSIFLTTLLLTLSNPLTIVFWAGVFSAKIIENDMNKKDMYKFGTGAVLSTIFFLSLVSILGNITSKFLSANIIKYLNIIVGVLLIYFAIKMIIKKEESEEE